MSERPTTAAEPTPYGDVEEVFELAVWIVGLLGYAKKGGYEGEARPGVAWERLRPAILAIEAEARQQDGSALRAALEPIDDAVQYAIAFMNDPEGLAASREQWRDQLRTALHDLRALAALPPSAPATDCNDPEHPSGAYCRNTTGLPACYVPPSAPPALDEKGGCYFCGATGIASHAGCRGGNIPLPGDEDIERWFAAFAKVSGLDAKRLPGKRVIWGRFAAEYARLQEQDR